MLVISKLQKAMHTALIAHHVRSEHIMPLQAVRPVLIVQPVLIATRLRKLRHQPVQLARREHIQRPALRVVRLAGRKHMRQPVPAVAVHVRTNRRCRKIAVVKELVHVRQLAILRQVLGLLQIGRIVPEKAITK